MSSTHQLESMRETVSRMRNELVSLRLENEKLQNIVVQKSETSSTSTAAAMATNVGGEDDADDRRPLSTMSDQRQVHYASCT